MRDQIKMTLIDAGRIGQTHAKSFASFPDVEVVVVCDPMIAAAEGVKPLARAGGVTDLAREALGRPGIKAMVICTPTRCPCRSSSRWLLRPRERSFVKSQSHWIYWKEGCPVKGQCYLDRK